MVLKQPKTKNELYSLVERELEMAIRYANLTVDYMFKELYFRMDKRSRQCREDLIETMMEGYRVYCSELLNEGFMNADTSRHQRFIDGACRVNDQDVVVLEMQRQKPNNGFDRFIAYGCGIVEYRGLVNEAYDYGKNIIILFTCFPLTDEMKKKTSYIVHRTTQGSVVSELITLVIVPLHGLEHLFQKPVDELTKKERYCLWLAHRHEEKYEEKIQEIIEKEEGLQMAEAVLKDIRNSKRIFTEVMNKHYLITHQMELNKADQLIKEAKKETEQERKLRLEAEQKVNEEKLKVTEVEQKVNEVLHKQKISDYIIELITQGYSVEEAKKLAEEKYQN